MRLHVSVKNLEYLFFPGFAVAETSSKTNEKTTNLLALSGKTNEISKSTKNAEGDTLFFKVSVTNSNCAAKSFADITAVLLTYVIHVRSSVLQ